MNHSQKQPSLLLFLPLIIWFVSACTPQSTLEKIKQEKVIHVITRNAPTTYYEDRDGPAGFEYELVKKFSDYLGVELRLRFVNDLGETQSIIENGFAHLATAGIAITPDKLSRFRFSTTYLEVKPTIIYRKGSLRPRKIADILDSPVHVLANSHHVEKLSALKAKYKTLNWVEHTDMEIFDLLNQIEQNEIRYAIVDSNELKLYQALFPHAKAGFELAETDKHAWLFPASDDNSLLEVANTFFTKIKADGTLEKLRHQYYDHVNQLNYVGARSFIRDIEARLPKYRSLFETTASKLGLDWRLLAAIGYQESHWQPKAKSPTGVRGLMMLTRTTAKEMGIRNRLDPASSVLGGAKYFSKVHKRIPSRIAEPDRTWFALAAYNVGFGHLEDARILTQRGGANPDFWMDVKKFLPLLAKKKWYSKTRHGFARGNEPVSYVQNIRRYYDVLVWLEATAFNKKTVAQQKPPANEINESATPAINPVRIEARLPISEIPPTL
ncbi:MAG: membrane-bound lytic murein transglycosylase MltF [Gammaproteobacteria bacterium]|nr:MAG: membrane-bound lytic murein transglycosylase MltF [Gammaproteobacteria bacterium]